MNYLRIGNRFFNNADQIEFYDLIRIEAFYYGELRKLEEGMMRNMKRIMMVGLAVVMMHAGTGLAVAQTETMPIESPEYMIDSVHSTIGFAVKHLAIATTRGRFMDYDGAVNFDPKNLEAFKAKVTIQVASINTDNEGRDNHLRSGDFFDAEEFPVITFVSNRLEKRGEGLILVGDLTIRDVTREITMPVEISGPVVGPKGKNVVALSAQTTINRLDYGVSWSKTMDNGGLVVDSNVKINVELELHQK